MNVEIGTEAALFPEKEYINGISLQCVKKLSLHKLHYFQGSSNETRVKMANERAGKLLT
jgi:hypothetical protein